MSEFNKYTHVERFGTSPVQGIDQGECYIFPKLDGTNGSVWMGDAGIKCGSRNRELTPDADNAGFLLATLQDSTIQAFAQQHPTLKLFGEWLVPHSIKGYLDNAWRKFYIFDVYDMQNERYLPFPEYSPLLEAAGLTYIRPLSVCKNPSYEMLMEAVQANTFLMASGIGEGIVIKNYDFINRFGDAKFAKIVHSEFKVSRGATKVDLLTSAIIEEQIVEQYVTPTLVGKVFDKISTAESGWESRYIPRFIHTVFHELVTEELWEAIKAAKNPTINFKTLALLCTQKVKELRPEVF